METAALWLRPGAVSFGLNYDHSSVNSDVPQLGPSQPRRGWMGAISNQYVVDDMDCIHGDHAQYTFNRSAEQAAYALLRAIDALLSTMPVIAPTRCPLYGGSFCPYL